MICSRQQQAIYSLCLVIQEEMVGSDRHRARAMFDGKYHLPPLPPSQDIKSGKPICILTSLPEFQRKRLPKCNPLHLKRLSDLRSHSTNRTDELPHSLRLRLRTLGPMVRGNRPQAHPSSFPPPRQLVPDPCCVGAKLWVYARGQIAVWPFECWRVRDAGHGG